MPRETLERSVLRQIGNPATAAKELASFRKAAKSLSSKHPRFIEEYPKQWIVVYDGKVRARGQTMQSAMLQAKNQNIPIHSAIIRYIDRNERTFIL
jgi:hypothetical protein